MSETASALRLQDLSVSYGSARKRRLPAVVDGVSFEVAAGETVGLVGESGSGKTTIVRAILGITGPSAGSVAVNGRDVTHLPVRQRRSMVTELTAVFQDPFSSLSPFQTVGATVTEPLRGRKLGRDQAQRLAAETMTSVGLAPGDLERYPHQFSGGQRQRIALARALVGSPQVVVMDEPVSALDLSTQAQILNLLADLRDRNRYAVLFVSHDLGVVRFLCQRVVVLYHGMVMEAGTAADVTATPLSPYSKALIAVAPVPHPAEQARRRAQRATAPAPGQTRVTPGGAGCPFAPRCPDATSVCQTERPALRQLGGRLVACHHVA